MPNANTRYDALIADVRAKLMAEFEASPKLQAEFVQAEDYAALWLAEAERDTGALSTYKSKFDDADNEAAFKAAEAAGRIRALHH